ncbi:DUF3618 domain-containing protein [Streptomyces sp. NPDC058335]|uniref:DUF3618 domain-containing protein n=1 Tax=Streptomyces sp. NPDC058335 TaxID=3346451 RepID=UPI00365891B1
MTDRAAADGAAELRKQIAQTRSQLGSTVEELAAKTDLRGRAKARAADLKDRAGAMTVQLRSSAAQAGHTVQERAGRAGHTVQEKAKGAGHTVQEKAAHAGHTSRSRVKGGRHDRQAGGAHVVTGVEDTASRAERTVPAPLRAPVGFARRHPRPVMIVAAAGAVIVAAGLLGRRRTSRC